MTGKPRTGRGERLTHGYEKIAADLEEQIKSGKYPVGARLPTKAQLMNEYGVSLNTVDRAIRELKKAGLAEPRQGRGTYVTAPPPRRPTYDDLVKAIAALDRKVDDIRAQLDQMQKDQSAARIHALASGQDQAGPG